MMSCIFCKIVKGEIPSKKVYENNNIVAFYDVNPQAPIHILVIPKEHIESVDAINEDNCALVAEIFKKIPEIAEHAGIRGGYRVVSNVGENACQSVHHLHFHILGGEKLSDKMA
ncbi:MAG: histidine triad nucleotide-binding protein [Ruminococcaceae bacterium]|nr:histidine triad nucleotide-binding protein [Oscillospiraceae bacterium]